MEDPVKLNPIGPCSGFLNDMLCILVAQGAAKRLRSKENWSLSTFSNVICGLSTVFIFFPDLQLDLQQVSRTLVTSMHSTIFESPEK